MNKIELEKNMLSKIPGKLIKEVIAGGSNGSIIVLGIGDTEFSLFVNCIWRLEQANEVLTGWNESNDAKNGNLTRRIKELEADTIKSIELSAFFDFKIHFVSGKTLNIFCDVTPQYEPDYYDENWVICDIQADKCYAINKYFTIATSKYS